MQKSEVYIIRARPHDIDRESEFLSGVLSLGFPLVPDLSLLTDVEIKQISEQQYGEHPLAAAQLRTFRSVKIGSLVLCPSPSKPENIYLLRTTSTYRFRPERVDDTYGDPHTLDATHLSTFSRTDLDDSIQKSFRSSRKSVTAVSHLEPLVQMLIPSTKSSSSLANPSSREKALAALEGLLNSQHDQVRLSAALALLEQKV